MVSEKRPVGFTEEDEKALRDRFAINGYCGCDGAYDDGCPFCDDKKFSEWWLKRRLARTNLRII